MYQPVFRNTPARAGRTLRMLAGAAVSAASLYAPAALANHIDLFDEGPFSIDAGVNSGEARATQANPPSAASTLGGRRDVSLSASDSPAAVSFRTFASLDPSPGRIFFRVEAQQSGSLLVRIGAGGALNANFVDIPNSTLDWDRVRLVFTGNSSPTGVLVSLTSDGVGTANVSNSFAGGTGNLDFLLTEFTADNSAFTPSVLRDIDLVELRINGASRTSFSLESFERSGSVAPPDGGQVPVPGVAGLLAISAFGLLRRRAPADLRRVRAH